MTILVKRARPPRGQFRSPPIHDDSGGNSTANTGAVMQPPVRDDSGEKGKDDTRAVPHDDSGEMSKGDTSAVSGGKKAPRVSSKTAEMSPQKGPMKNKD
jgi:hypothetical protein